MFDKMLNSIIAVMIIIIVYFMVYKSENFKGYQQAVKKKDNIYTSGATMRVLAQDFSDSSQGNRTTIPNAMINLSKLV